MLVLMVTETKHQIAALELMRDIGSVYPSKVCGQFSTFAALERKCLATRRGRTGPFDITEAGRLAIAKAENRVLADLTKALRDIEAREFGVSGRSATEINRWFNERARAALEGRRFKE